MSSFSLFSFVETATSSSRPLKGQIYKATIPDALFYSREMCPFTTMFDKLRYSGIIASKERTTSDDSGLLNFTDVLWTLWSEVRTAPPPLKIGGGQLCRCPVQYHA
ncbi:unnamed protein product [Echinostoma caproni]|uniref:GST N-terminal domain-containing protein n=1 Tax=Echinostoma caproni TaxID=27848 RepID=A0A183ACR7_9TREM|nr:unnamed protein product [Echinostoma caproni]